MNVNHNHLYCMCLIVFNRFQCQYILGYLFFSVFIFVFYFVFFSCFLVPTGSDIIVVEKIIGIHKHKYIHIHIRTRFFLCTMNFSWFFIVTHSIPTLQLAHLAHTRTHTNEMKCKWIQLHLLNVGRKFSMNNFEHVQNCNYMALWYFRV